MTQMLTILGILGGVLGGLFGFFGFVIAIYDILCRGFSLLLGLMGASGATMGSTGISWVSGLAIFTMVFLFIGILWLMWHHPWETLVAVIVIAIVYLGITYGLGLKIHVPWVASGVGLAALPMRTDQNGAKKKSLVDRRRGSGA